MVNVLISSNNISFSINLINKLDTNKHIFRIYRIAQNARQAIEILNDESNNIDIILLHFKEFGSDEQMMLHQIEDKNKYERSCIIICNKEVVVKTLYNNPVVCSIISKNITYEKILTIVNKLVDYKTHSTSNNLRKKILNELSYLNYKISHKGTQYLLKSIEYVASNPQKDLIILEKDVYPLLAVQYNDSLNNIKCSINRANSNMYYECEFEKLKKYFNLSKDIKPKIKTVINTIVNKVL